MTSLRLGIVILACILVLGCTNTASQDQGNLTISPQAQLYFDSLTYGMDDTSYRYQYTESIGNYTQHFNLALTEEGKEISISTNLFNRSIFVSNDNRTAICVTNDVTVQCVNAGNNTEVKSYVAQLSARAFDSYAKETERTRLEALYEKGAVQFSDKGIQSVNGESCARIGIDIDYQRLTIGEAKELGVVTTGPQHFFGESCIRSDGLAIHKSFEYEYQGRTQRTVVSDVQYGRNPTILFPQNITNDSAFDILAFVTDVERGYISCLPRNDFGMCIRMLALAHDMPQLCSQALEKHDDCFLIFAELRKNPVYCEQVEGVDVQENCYGVIAQIYGNQTYCSNIDNQTKYAMCLNSSQVAYERPRSYADPQNHTQGSTEIPDFLLPYLQ